MQPAEIKAQLQSVMDSFIGDHMTIDLAHKIKHSISKKLYDLSGIQEIPIKVECRSLLYDSITVALYRKSDGKEITSCAELMLLIGLITPEEAMIMEIMDS
jgi:hypothetical protein